MKYVSIKRLLVLPMTISIAAMLMASPAQADRISNERLEKQKRYLEMRERERAAKKREKEREQYNKSVSKRNCTAAKNRLNKYKTATALYDRDKDGKKVYLDKSERKKAEKQAGADVKKWCK